MVLFKKIVAFFIAMMNVFMLNTGIKKVETGMTDKAKPITLADKSESDLCETAEYAYNAKNSVQGVYTTPQRKAYKMQNNDVSLTHTLSGGCKTATLKDKNGNVLIENSFKSFYTEKSGAKYIFETSVASGRVNTIRMGEYYYEFHIRDLSSPVFYVDKTYHMYADRLYMQYSILANKATKSLKEFGSEISIPVSATEAVEYKDKNGTGSSLNAMDCESVEYIAFMIKGVGVVGFIIPSDGSTQKVTLNKVAGNYVLRQYAQFDTNAGLNDYKENGGYALNTVSFGCRIYTDDTASFDGVNTAAQQERDPLSDITVEPGTSNAKYLGYDALRGAYTFRMDGIGFGAAYINPDRQYTAPVTIKGSDEDRTVYFRAAGDNGCLEAAALLDSTNTLMPIEVQVCKNFCGDGGESIYGALDRQYGDSVFPICVEKNKELKFTLTDVYQNWGKYPLKQLSSIEFHVGYYHLSTGTTESNCIAPYFVYGKDGWTLPDFRNRSGDMWTTQPQFNSVGILKFMSYKNGITNNTNYSEFAGSVIDSCGLTYSDVTNTYTDDSGNYTYSVRHVEFPQTDENRTYYTLKVKFDKKVTYDNFRDDFDLFYFDGRFVKFNKISYLDKNNIAKSASVDTSSANRYYTLGNDCPYFGFYNITDDTLYRLDENFGCNFALIIRDSKITVRGGEKNIPFLFRETSTSDMTSGALTLDTDSITFNKGDTIEINMILLPWGTGKETNGNNIIKVREDSAKNPITVTAEKGTVAADKFVPIVKAENDEAIFTLTGGRNNNAVVVKGLTSLKAPKVEKLENGVFVDYELASSNGYDGYTVKADEDGTYAVSFIYTATDPYETNTFRVTTAK